MYCYHSHFTDRKHSELRYFSQDHPAGDAWFWARAVWSHPLTHSASFVFFCRPSESLGFSVCKEGKNTHIPEWLWGLDQMYAGSWNTLDAKEKEVNKFGYSSRTWQLQQLATRGKSRAEDLIPSRVLVDCWMVKNSIGTFFSLCPDPVNSDILPMQKLVELTFLQMKWGIDLKHFQGPFANTSSGRMYAGGSLAVSHLGVAVVGGSSY